MYHIDLDGTGRIQLPSMHDYMDDNTIQEQDIKKALMRPRGRVIVIHGLSLAPGREEKYSVVCKSVVCVSVINPVKNIPLIISFVPSSRHVSQVATAPHLFLD